MSDDLDNMSDAQLNELFAVEVVGLERRSETLWQERGLNRQYWRAEDCEFCTDANAVLPWLEKEAVQIERHYQLTNGIVDDSKPLVWRVEIMRRHPGEEDVWHAGQSSIFARAAVLALLRAKRAEKGTK